MEKARKASATLVQRLHAISRQKPIEPKREPQRDCGKSRGCASKPDEGGDITLKIKLNPCDVRVTADRAQIEQVVLNFAVNARDAMMNGG